MQNFVLRRKSKLLCAKLLILEPTTRIYQAINYFINIYDKILYKLYQTLLNILKYS